MTLDDLLHDIHALEEELRIYERKYGVRTETFYEAYANGEEPDDNAWVRDWAAWASAYKICQKLRQEYEETIRRLRLNTHSVSHLIAKTARHESIPVPA
jgi:hypothetical protein